MPLAEHLRELRNRLAKALLAIVVVTVVAAFFYKDIIDFFTEPVLDVGRLLTSFAELAKTQRRQPCAQIVASTACSRRSRSR